MKKIFFGLILLIAIQGQSFAVLPPLWQGVQELKTILNDKRLGEYLDSGDVITSIKKTDDGWVIITNKKNVAVQVSYEHSPRPGPVPFSLKFMGRPKTTP